MLYQMYAWQDIYEISLFDHVSQWNSHVNKAYNIFESQY